VQNFVAPFAEYHGHEEPASIRSNNGVFGAVDAATVYNFCCAEGSNPRTVRLAAKFVF
jgi:hypothetical protein